MNLTSETTQQQSYESKVSSDKTIGNISSKTDQFIISNQTLLWRSRTKRSEKTLRMVTEAMENYTNEEVGQCPLVLAKAPAVIENHQFIRGRKL